MRLLKYLYGITISGKLFANELIDCLLKSGFIQYQHQMFIYYNYAPDGTKIVVSYYVDECVYFYTYESLVKWFMETIGKRFHVNFLGYVHWFISIIISQMKYHSISVYQARFDTSIVAR